MTRYENEILVHVGARRPELNVRWLWHSTRAAGAARSSGIAGPAGTSGAVTRRQMQAVAAAA